MTKFPRILEYKPEETLAPRLAFLGACGVAHSDLAKVVLRAPMAMELSVSDTLAPRAAFLRGEVGLPEGSLGKLILRHPQVLTCTEDAMRRRVAYLRGVVGLGAAEAGRAVLAHPQVLHYKIDSMQERVDYLRGEVGMTPAQVAAAVARFPQLFSLNVQANLGPKWRYLVEELGGGVATLCAYPGYFSLSLAGRCVRRAAGGGGLAGAAAWLAVDTHLVPGRRSVGITRSAFAFLGLTMPRFPRLSGSSPATASCWRSSPRRQYPSRWATSSAPTSSLPPPSRDPRWPRTRSSRRRWR